MLGYEFIGLKFKSSMSLKKKIGTKNLLVHLYNHPKEN